MTMAVGEKPDILIVLTNLSYRLDHDERDYDYRVVLRAIEEITKLREQEKK